MAAKPFLRGKNTTLRFYIDGQLFDIDVKSWDITRNGTEHTDGVNGEQADRLDFSFSHYSMNIEAYVKDLRALDQLLDFQANEDTSAPPLATAGSVRMKPRDGTSKAYVLGDVVIGQWSLKSGGRTDTMMQTVPIRFASLTPAPTI